MMFGGVILITMLQILISIHRKLETINISLIHCLEMCILIKMLGILMNIHGKHLTIDGIEKI